MLAAALVGGVAATGVLAAWSAAEFGRADFRAGTFALSSRTTEDPFVRHDAGDPATIAWPTAPLFPGEATAGWVQVQSTGSVPGTVSLSGVDLGDIVPGSPEEVLRDTLRVRVSAAASPSPTPGACTIGTPGTEVVGLDSVPSLPPEPLQPAGANTVTFCIVLTLPVDAPAAAQSASLTPVWIFSGSSG
ncbi:SipW-dependent-type signal peptide-containing protein [Microbacterium sp. NPDC057407]|uniref:SipW-dependent-type signal peptide-containing protein n=1 Tax=Microbacterium sp. NPDC057407 TaxID=3346120 RepID=UPI003672447E